MKAINTLEDIENELPAYIEKAKNGSQHLATGSLSVPLAQAIMTIARELKELKDKLQVQ